MNRCVFFDRDGTLNVDYLHIKDYNAVKVKRGVYETLRTLAQTDYKIIIASNQGAIAKGLYTDEETQRFNKTLIERINRHGGRIDATYYCPHSPEEHCFCRKPEPGMLIEAALEFNLDLTQSWMVGDAETDIEAGQKTRCKTILITKGKMESKADYKIRRLNEILPIILHHSKL